MDKSNDGYLFSKQLQIGKGISIWRQEKFSQLYKAKAQERLKMFMWKLLSNSLPTKQDL